MKKLLFTFIAAVALVTSVSTVNAQSYKTSLGLGIDFGTGSTLVGPSVKHFFNSNSAIEGDILFGGNSTLIQAFYQYHGDISGASGLKWYVGGGPGVQLYDGGSNFLLRPMVGLDFKIPSAPIGFAFDWRPAMQFYDGGSDFEAARFGLGIKYTF
jgi:hypothetical protein